MPLENFFTFTSAQFESFTRSRRAGMRFARSARETPDIWPNTESVARAVR
jgi:hypothetical protein